MAGATLLDGTETAGGEMQAEPQPPTMAQRDLEGARTALRLAEITQAARLRRIEMARDAMAGAVRDAKRAADRDPALDFDRKAAQRGAREAVGIAAAAGSYECDVERMGKDGAKVLMSRMDEDDSNDLEF